MQILNSFQKWADWYGRAHGYVVIPHGNWVILSKDGEFNERMSVSGIQRLIELNNDAESIAS